MTNENFKFKDREGFIRKVARTVADIRTTTEESTGFYAQWDELIRQIVERMLEANDMVQNGTNMSTTMRNKVRKQVADLIITGEIKGRNCFTDVERRKNHSIDRIIKKRRDDYEEDRKRFIEKVNQDCCDAITDAIEWCRYEEAIKAEHMFRLFNRAVHSATDSESRDEIDAANIFTHLLSQPYEFKVKVVELINEECLQNVIDYARWNQHSSSEGANIVRRQQGAAEAEFANDCRDRKRFDEEFYAEELAEIKADVETFKTQIPAGNIVPDQPILHTTAQQVA